MLADNWDRGSLYSYRAFSFPSEMPYDAIKQPVMFITGERDGALTKGAKKVRSIWLHAFLHGKSITGHSITKQMCFCTADLSLLLHWQRITRQTCLPG